MNIDKERELIDKYKHLLDKQFVEWKNGLGFMEVTDGWTHIIEGMLESIDRHQKMVTKQLRYKNDEKTKNWDCVYTDPMSVKISCIKEKFSSLRVYYEVTPEHKPWLDGVVTMATETASRTCECCGTTDTSVLGMTSGWITVICKPCYDKKAVEMSPEWSKRNEWMSKD